MKFTEYPSVLLLIWFTDEFKKNSALYFFSAPRGGYQHTPTPNQKPSPTPSSSPIFGPKRVENVCWLVPKFMLI